MSNYSNAQKRFDEGTNAFISGDLNDSVTAFSEVIQMDPDFSLAYASRGLAFFNQHKLNLAIEDFEKFIHSGL
jgi:lipoprotein NlpI